MIRLRMLAPAGVLLLCFSLPTLAHSAVPGSPACKRELEVTQKKMRESLALVSFGQDTPQPQKCEALSRHLTLANEIRESFARCKTRDARAESVGNADDVIDATRVTYNKLCPPRPGLVRVNMIEVKHVTRDQLPKPLAAVHRCSEGAEGPMYSTNERFELGRLVVLGCAGNPNATVEEARARNARPELLKKEQAYLYITRDMDGDDPHRLSFPILGIDGREARVDQLFADRVVPGEKRDEISSFWEPMTEGVCRVHAVWRVADAKANLVLWQEATDCSGRTEFKTVLDRR